MATGSQNVIVDALPYIDTEYDDPGVKELVFAIIEEEKKRFRPTKNYLEHLPPLDLEKYETEVMKKEFERLSVKQPMESLSMKRYQLPGPPQGKLNDYSAWLECVNNSFAQLEHQNTRICNLEIMQEYGCESWKQYLKTITAMVQDVQKQLPAVKKQIQDINWQRKNDQSDAGEKLKRLNGQWVGLVSKNFEIEKACIDLEAKIQELEPQVLAMEEEARNRPKSPELQPQEQVPVPMEEDNQDDENEGEDSEDEDGDEEIGPQPINPKATD